jgi:nicotinate-nucleotide adenylyltransferase
MKLGLMGGTFNPIHIGHIKIAYKVLNDFDLSKVIFIPSGDPPHKKARGVVEASHRLKMIKLAIGNDKRFEASDIEIKREGKSYTLDTIREIKNIYGVEADVYFIAGVDSALDLPKWREPLKILSLAHFVAVERPGFSLEELDGKYRKRIITVGEISIDISSSVIRKRLREGKPIKSLVPESVEEYIRKNRLYI